MRDGSLNVLSGLMQADLSLLPDFVPNLLEMWSLIAPTYTHAAVERDPRAVHEQLYGYRGLADRPDPYARAQWRLHRLLTWLSGNPVYGLVLNGSVISISACRGCTTPTRLAAPRHRTSGERCTRRRCLSMASERRRSCGVTQSIRCVARTGPYCWMACLLARRRAMRRPVAALVSPERLPLREICVRPDISSIPQKEAAACQCLVSMA